MKSGVYVQVSANKTRGSELLNVHIKQSLILIHIVSVYCIHHYDTVVGNYCTLTVYSPHLKKVHITNLSFEIAVSSAD